MSKVEFMISDARCNVSDKLRTTMVRNVIGGENAVIIVPDQFHFETEKAVYRAFGENTVFFPNVKVTTFSKLSDDLISEYGSKDDRTACANDITKNIIMYRAVNEVQDSLSVFSRNAKKSGFAAKMYSTIAMLKTAGLSGDKYEKTIDAVKEDFRDSNKSLFGKLEDIRLIYGAFERQMSRFRYSDQLDRITTASMLAIKNGCFKGKNFYFDKFSDFSERQMDFIRTVIAAAEDVTFTFTSDCSDNCREMFSTVNSTIRSLADYADECGKTVCGINVPITENTRFAGTPTLQEISENLYGTPDKNADMSGISIIRANDVHNEEDFIAAEIRRLCVLENKYRYNEIAVLCPEPSDYKAAVESSFEKYEIPVFCDIPESILHMPLVNLVTSLLNALRSYTVENILSYVKTGFLQKTVTDKDGKTRTLGITMKEISDFEDHIYIWGIDADDLEHEFVIPSTTTRRDELSRAENAELVRENIIPPLLELKKDIGNKCSGAEITRKLCSFLFDKIGIERSVMAHCKTAGSEVLTDSDSAAISSYQTLWNKMLEIFEALNAALGDGETDSESTNDSPKMSIGEYYHLFRDICSAATLAQPPEVKDSVLVGDISRTRTEDPKVVFIAGACYGHFPAVEKSKGIFSDYETELLGESIVKLARNRKERYCYEMYRAYMALTSPSERLYITYPVLNISCGTAAPSDIITQLCDSYGITVKNANELDDTFYCSSRRAAQQRFAKCYNSVSAERETLKTALSQAECDDFTEKLDRIALLRSKKHLHKLKPATAEALFGRKTFSATSIEKLNDCKFGYFCTNGLRVNTAFRKDLNATNVGTIIHYILQSFLQRYCNDLDIFISMTRMDMSRVVEDILTEYKKNELINSTFFNSERFIYLYENIISSAALDVLTVLQTEFAARDYRPKFFELTISDESPVCTSPVVNRTQPLSTDALAEAELNNGKGSDIRDITAKEDPDAPITINTPPYQIKLRNNITIKLTGNVDRVDTFTGSDGKEYMRVVDYKTGSRSFSIDKAYFGVSNQMLLYLIALSDANKELLPGGVSYMPAMATSPANTERDSLNLLFGDHIQSGLLVKYPVNEENDSTGAIDETTTEAEKFAENVTQYRKSKATNEQARYIYTKSAEPKHSYSKDIYDEFAGGCIAQTTRTLQSLYDGEVHAAPTVYKEGSEIMRPCRYCSFRSICGYNVQSEFMLSMDLVPEQFHPQKEDKPKTSTAAKEKRSAKKKADPLQLNEDKEDSR